MSSSDTPIKPFSFCSGKVGDLGTGQVLPEGPINTFVTLLRDGKIQLEKQPTPSSPTEFLSSDTWFQWLKTSIGATSLSAITTTDAKNIKGFELKLKPSSSSKTTLHFTTDAFPSALGLTLPPNGAASGLLGNGEILILGLDLKNSPDLKMTLPEVFDFAGLHDLANGLSFLREPGLQISCELKSAAEGSQSHRNAIWFEPRNSYKTVIRLQFTVPLDEIREFFTQRLLMKANDSPKDAEDSPGITAAYVVVKKTLREMGWQSDRSKFSMEVDVTLVAKLKIHLTGSAFIDFSVALTFNPSSFNFDLVPGPDNFNNVLQWLATTAGIVDFNTQLAAMKSALGIKTIDFTRISLTFATGQFTPIHLRLELKVVHQEAVFLFSYTWSKGGGGKLKAELMSKSLMSALDADERKLNPDWEEYLVFNNSHSESLVLTSLFKNDNNPPSEVGGHLTTPPQELGGHMSHLVLEVGGGEIALYGRLSLQKAESDLSLDSITFSGRYRWKVVPKQFDISFTVSCTLLGVHDQTPAYMTGKVKCTTSAAENKKVWTLSTSVENLSISALERFLGGSSSSDIMAFIGKLQIVSLDITYTFPSSFSSNGILRLGDLELDLTFTHKKGKCDFEAILRPASKESTIGKVLDSITGSAASLDLPPFVTDIKLRGDSGGNSSTVRIKFSRNATELLFVASFHIGPLGFTFLQHRRAGSKVIKRVIKVSAQLPSFTIPMIDNPVQPFGELFYMWVHARAEDTAPAGFTADEVMKINAQLPDPRDHLVFKKTTQKENVSVIAEGSHFVLISEEPRAVTIDYVFQKSARYDESDKPAEEKKTDALAVRQPPARSRDPKTTADKTPEDPPGETQMAAFKKSIGPLSISNIGLQYKDHVLSVHLDAELLLGPIGLSLLGLTLELTLKGEFNLQKIPSGEIKVSLDGMAVSFDQPPVEIAGLFKHTETATEESYGGGLIVGFEPYRFMAAGVYTKTLGDHGFKSVFVFGKLEGPLIILEFAEISGITGGFGYNINLKLPQVNEVLQFPFLADISSEPEAALATMYAGGFFKPSEGSFWVAAGLKVKAFQALTVDAVVVVGWNPYVSLGIFGVAVIDVPKLKPNQSNAKLLRIELGFIATVDFRSGVIKFEGQLTQNSYILSPDCHLTGGFAIYYWFAAADAAAANSSLEGDWVVTIGGYHRQFIPPAHYPKPPPRVGISWKVSKSISVTGEAYFAITPKVCMGGVRLHATLSLGPLDAYFDAHADFLINFDPFYFIADIGVSVGVKYTLDLWFVSTDISVELHAELHLEGPPFSGRLYVDFYIFGFNIDFGPGATKGEKASLERFYQLVIQDDGKGVKVEADACGDHLFGCLAGMIADGSSSPLPSPAANKSQSVSQNWRVRAGDFSFRIACPFPINSASMGSSIDLYVPCISNSTNIYAKPMELEEHLSSTMTIEIKKVDADTEKLTWKVAEVVKNVPCALWGKYDRRTDPMRKNNDLASILKADNPTIPLTMGVIISAPDPRLPEEKILPFNPALQKPENAFPEDSNYPNFPDTSPASTQWCPVMPEGQPLPSKNPWAHVSEKWEESTKNQETVRQWSSAFSWKATLKAKAPDRLIKEFGKLYMAPPILTVG